MKINDLRMTVYPFPLCPSPHLLTNVRQLRADPGVPVEFVVNKNDSWRAAPVAILLTESDSWLSRRR